MKKAPLGKATSYFAKCARAVMCFALSICLAAPFTWNACSPDAKAYAAGDTALPLSYYLTNAGYVTPVKMQNPWGDCWSFAVVAAVESSILKETADLEQAAAVAEAEAETAAATEVTAAQSKSANDGEDEAYDVTKKVDVDPSTGKLKRGGEPMSSSASSSSNASTSTGAPQSLDGTSAGSAEKDAGSTALGGSSSAAFSDAIAEELAAQASSVDMSQPKLLALNDTIDISERAIAWLVHELQTEESGGSQAGEGFYRMEPNDFLTQLAEGNFDMIGSQLVARQGLIAESLVPYRYNGYSGSPIWYSTGSSEGAWDDARAKDWSVDASLRTNIDLGWVVSGIRRLTSPAELEIDYSTGLSNYVGYDSSATQAIKETLVEIGGVAIALEADVSLPTEVIRGNLVDAPPSEHFTYSTWSQYVGADVVNCNHAATIVGWDDNYSAANFAGTTSGQPPANGAWLCKNNWGSDALYSTEGNAGDSTHWGITASPETGYAATPDADGTQASGFFWLSYYDHSILNPMAFEVTPVDEDFENVYQYDFLGSAEYSKPATYNGDVWVANLYDAKDLELVEAVSAQTFAPGDSVDVVFYTLPARLNTNEMSANDIFEEADAVAHQTATFEYGGFHTIELDNPILLTKGQRFIVAEHVYTTSDPDEGLLFDNSYLNLELSYLDTVEGIGQTTKSKVVANPGETFVCLTDGEWLELDDFAKQSAEMPGASTENIEYGNALIKAFTSTTSMSKIGQIYERVRLK